MNTLFWTIALYFVARHYWRKKPAFREYVKLFLGGHIHDRAAAILEKEQVRQKAERKAAAATPSPPPKAAVTPANQNPVLKVRKKSEKQFLEL